MAVHTISDPVLHHVLFYDYVTNMLARRGPYRAAHLAAAQTYKDAGKLVMAGALGDPPRGAMFVFRVDDLAEIETFVAGDPYVQNDLVTGHSVVPWSVAIS